MTLRLHCSSGLRKVRRPWLYVLLVCLPGLRATADAQGPKGFAVDAALQWLANHQQKDGRWSFSLEKVARERQADGCECHQEDDPIPPHHANDDSPNDLRATALVTLAFLSAGHTHHQGKYCGAVKKAIAVLKDRALRNCGRMFDANQQIVQDHAMFTQAYATQALVECYLRTRDPDLLDAAQMATDEICSRRILGGGWPTGLLLAMGKGGDSNIHATYCNVTALLLAAKAGLRLDPFALTGVGDWLATLEQLGPPDGYTEAARAGLPNRRALPSGLFLRLTVGATADGVPQRVGQDWVDDRIAELQNHRVAWRKDPFSGYSSALVMHRAGPQALQNAALPDLVNVQWNAVNNKPHRNGSVTLKVADDQDGHKGGTRLYWTSMAVLISNCQERCRLMLDAPMVPARIIAPREEQPKSR